MARPAMEGAGAEAERPAAFAGAVTWLFLGLITIALSQTGRDLSRALDARWLVKVPRDLKVSMKDDISTIMQWLVEGAHFGPLGFTDLTGGIAWLLDQPYELVKVLLVDGFVRGLGDQAVQVLPPLSWIAVIFVMVAIGHYAKGISLAFFVGLCFLYLAVFGSWDSAMVTLASILIAVPLGVAGGLLLGIAGYRWRRFDRVMTPGLDLMQTVPVFAYLVPILFLFGFGPVAALVATIIYAMPPMVRITTLALRGVPTEIREFAIMVGCTPRQMTWRVMVPAAMPGLMVGVNQVIMLSLNMVIIAAMIGAGGLGYDVLTSLRRLDIGGGLEAGIAIVVLAITLDRLSYAFVNRPPPEHGETARAFGRRHPYILAVLVVVLGCGLVGVVLPVIQHYPAALQITTGAFWETLVEAINVNFFDQLNALKAFMLLNLLVPVKRFLLGVPWPWFILLVTFAGWRLGRWKLALLCFLLLTFILVNGLWTDAMVTIYLCGVSVSIAAAIGIPLGILAAQNQQAERVIGGSIDTLQTLPSFVYLIPVVMLFQVGDFSAMIAVVLYALAPAVRYTAHGIRTIDSQLIEAGTVSGCTPWQLLWRIKLPLALPEIMLGINQTIMLALSMLVITALVGTRDLGQEVYIALTKADIGRGIVAGVSVAFIAIVADRLIAAGVRRARGRLGLVATEARSR